MPADQRLVTLASTSELIKAGVVHDHRSPFGLPRGIAGRLAGWYMGWSDAQHRELARSVSVADHRVVLEVGFGPGQLLSMIHARCPAATLCGVDPSELMVRKASRRNPTADLRIGAAAAMTFQDSFGDIVVSVNNVAMWPDLDTGLAEIDRVLKPGGSVFVAWHGGHDPRGHQRQLVLDDQRREAITSAMTSRFRGTKVSVLQHSVTWTATTTSPTTPINKMRNPASK